MLMKTQKLNHKNVFSASQPLGLLPFPENQCRAFGGDTDLVSSMHLAGGHQAIQRVLKLACQGVLEVGSPVFGIAAVLEEQRFGAGGELHLEGRSRMLVEDLASLRDFKVQDFLQITWSKRVIDNRFLNAPQKFGRKVGLNGS